MSRSPGYSSGLGPVAEPAFFRRPSSTRSTSSSSFLSTTASSLSETDRYGAYDDDDDNDESSTEGDDSSEDDRSTEGLYSSSGLSGDEARLVSRLDSSLAGPSSSTATASARTASPVARSNLRLSLAVLRARQSLATHSFDALAAALKSLAAALPPLATLVRRPHAGEEGGGGSGGGAGQDNPLGVFVPILARLARDVRAALLDDGDKGREFRRTKFAKEDAKALVALKQRWNAGGGAAGGKGKGRESDSLEWVGAVESAVKQNPPPDFLAEPAFAHLTSALLTSLEAFLLPSSLPRLSLSKLNLTDLDLDGWPALRRLEHVAAWYCSFTVATMEEATCKAGHALDGVRSLDLSKNRLTSFPLYLCRLFPNLETLSLSHNHFSHLPPWITLFSSLRRLRTHGNRLVSSRKALKPLSAGSSFRSGRARAHPKGAGARANVRDVLKSVQDTLVQTPLDRLLPSSWRVEETSLSAIAAQVYQKYSPTGAPVDGTIRPDANTELPLALLPPHLADLVESSYTCASCIRFLTPSSPLFVPTFYERVHHLDPGISIPSRLPPALHAPAPPPALAPQPALDSPLATPPRSNTPAPATRGLTAAERPATLEQRLLLALLARLDAPPPPPPPPPSATARRTSSFSSSLLRPASAPSAAAGTLPTLVIGGSGAHGRGWRFCALCAGAHLGVLEDALALREAHAGVEVWALGGEEEGGGKEDGWARWERVRRWSCECIVCVEERRVRSGEEREGRGGPGAGDGAKETWQQQQERGAREGVAEREAAPSSARPKVLRWYRRKEKLPEGVGRGAGTHAVVDGA
ncbi:leucine-rich repeat domain-containing protein [Rhodotorula paludigena]|uniref:leucine-rich repeat domain-containing protein n=1 Tax=Rhodotorula paludigena TaxID=86838 RepID=UPI00316E4369